MVSFQAIIFNLQPSSQGHNQGQNCLVLICVLSKVINIFPFVSIPNGLLKSTSAKINFLWHGERVKNFSIAFRVLLPVMFQSYLLREEDETVPKEHGFPELKQQWYLRGSIWQKSQLVIWSTSIGVRSCGFISLPCS